MAEPTSSSKNEISSAQAAARYLYSCLPKTDGSKTITYWNNGKATRLFTPADEALLMGALAGIERGTIRMGDNRLATIVQRASDQILKAIQNPGENTEQHTKHNVMMNDKLSTGIFYATKFGLLTSHQQLSIERTPIGFATASKNNDNFTGRY